MYEKRDKSLSGLNKRFSHPIGLQLRGVMVPPAMVTVRLNADDARDISAALDELIVARDRIASLDAERAEMLAMLRSVMQVLQVEAMMMHPSSRNPYRDVAESIRDLIARIEGGGAEGGAK
jgi:hypothetical protein